MGWDSVKNPLVSIVIPTYKRSDMVERALISALNQTYKNIEVLVVDDNDPNSEDRLKTKEIMKKYDNDSRVRYIEHFKNSGGSITRNTGINNANGDFIAFLDDDDEYFPNKIEKQYQLYLEKKEFNVGLIYCYVIGVNKEKEKISEYNYNIEGNALYESMMGCIAGTSLWFCPKEALVSVGGFENTPSKQDTIMIMKLMAAGYTIYRVPETLLYYYEYIGNKISGTGKNSINGEINARKYARELYEKLSDIKKINNVEYNFSKKLFALYIINKMNNEAIRELFTLIKLKPFSSNTIKATIKYIFAPIYIRCLTMKQKKRFK